MSEFQETGLAIIARQPIIRGRDLIGYLTNKIGRYSHYTNAWMGYRECSFSLPSDDDTVEEWLEDGINRDITVYNPQNQIIWNGFVNQITVNRGPLSITVGPLTEVSNRVTAVFNPLNTAVNPPTSGGRLLTGTVNDATSQAKFGIWEKVISTGPVTIAEAEQARNMHLQTFSYPSLTQNIGDVGQSNELEITCKGYGDFLASFVYTQTATGGTENASAKIAEVITAFNAINSGIISTNFNLIDENTFQVTRYENDDKTGDAVIKEITSLGDASNNRWTFGLYGDRVPVYRAAPSVIDYQQSIRSKESGIYSSNGDRIYPWDMVPARWLLLNDLMVGRETRDYRSDPRMIFIEEVSFESPFKVNLMGGKVNQLAQLLARISPGGLSG